MKPPRSPRPPGGTFSLGTLRPLRLFFKGFVHVLMDATNHENEVAQVGNLRHTY